jgi:hypothetical protein
MLGPPLLRTISANLPVFGIARQLSLPVLVFAPLLAGRRTANHLAWLELRWLETLPAEAAPPFIHNRRCRIGQFRNWCRVLTASPPMDAKT